MSLDVPGSRQPPADHRIAYGAGNFHFCDLRLPRTPEPHPTAIVIHGGYWRSLYGLDYMNHVCAALTGSGIATWNVEYRRLGNPGGGWPGTFDDVLNAAEHLHSISGTYNLDLTRLMTIGHSAGGHLALWVASRDKRVRSAIALAGITDLRRAWELHLSDSVVVQLLGGTPAGVPDRYAFASPIEHLPLAIPQKLFHGTTDKSVPFEMSEAYAHTAQLRGDDAELIRLEDAGHFELVHPETKEFGLVRNAALSLLRR